MTMLYVLAVAALLYATNAISTTSCDQCDTTDPDACNNGGSGSNTPGCYKDARPQSSSFGCYICQYEDPCKDFAKRCDMSVDYDCEQNYGDDYYCTTAQWYDQDDSTYYSCDYCKERTTTTTTQPTQNTGHSSTSSTQRISSTQSTSSTSGCPPCDTCPNGMHQNKICQFLNSVLSSVFMHETVHSHGDGYIGKT